MLLKVVIGKIGIIGPTAPYIDESLPEPSHTLETHQQNLENDNLMRMSQSNIRSRSTSFGPPTQDNDMLFNNNNNDYDNNNNGMPQQNGSLPMELAPLYPGYGTHYAYIYVGTPPKRQSVIIDTGYVM